MEDVPAKLSAEDLAVLREASEIVSERVSGVINDVVSDYPPEASFHITMCAMSIAFRMAQEVLVAAGMDGELSRKMLLVALTTASAPGSSPLSVGEAIEELVGPNQIGTVVDHEGTILKREVQ